MIKKMQILLSFLSVVCIAACRPSATASSSVAAMDVVMLGDSNTWIGGDSCDNPRGWNCHWRELAMPKSCRSYARSGATWTNTARTRRNTMENIGVLGPDNVIYNQACRLIDDVKAGVQPAPSLILIMAGTNDAWFHRKRPGLFADTPGDVNLSTASRLMPSQATSLVRSVLLSCGLLAKEFPRARIILFTPLPTTAATAANLSRVSDLIERCGDALSIPVVRLDAISGIDSESEKIAPKLTTDGTHTSVEGAHQVATRIAQALDSLLTSN